MIAAQGAAVTGFIPSLQAEKLRRIRRVSKAATVARRPHSTICVMSMPLANPVSVKYSPFLIGLHGVVHAVCTHTHGSGGLQCEIHTPVLYCVSNMESKSNVLRVYLYFILH